MAPGAMTLVAREVAEVVAEKDAKAIQHFFWGKGVGSVAVRV